MTRSCYISEISGDSLSFHSRWTESVCELMVYVAAMHEERALCGTNSSTSSSRMLRGRKDLAESTAALMRVTDALLPVAM